MKPAPPARPDYAWFCPLTTRWGDNDVYGHINNAVYYAYFDTVVNGWLIGQGLLDPGRSPVVGLVAATQCSYFASLAFPEPVEGGLKVERIGTTSVTYGVGIFAAGAARAAAAGSFTHVCVAAGAGAGPHRAVPLPGPLRKALGGLVRP